jgi:hypothetical protein
VNSGDLASNGFKNDRPLGLLFSNPVIFSRRAGLTVLIDGADNEVSVLNEKNLGGQFINWCPNPVCYKANHTIPTKLNRQ